MVRHAAGAGLHSVRLLAVHKIHPLKETTLAEYLESRYRPWLRPISAVALALATFAILPAQIVGGATVITALVGLDYTTAFLAVGGALILYSALGGMPSVTYGDVYQWVLMLGGFLIGVPIFISAAGGLSQVHRRRPRHACLVVERRQRHVESADDCRLARSPW